MFKIKYLIVLISLFLCTNVLAQSISPKVVTMLHSASIKVIDKNKEIVVDLEPDINQKLLGANCKYSVNKLSDKIDLSIECKFNNSKSTTILQTFCKSDGDTSFAMLNIKNNKISYEMKISCMVLGNEDS